MNYSMQRELILDYLKNTKEHPTAERIYSDLKERLPNLSLATVYRNCNKLCETGQIIRLKSEGKTDRFDADVSDHQHFICTSCGNVLDLFYKLPDEYVEKSLPEGCKKSLYQLYVYGLCDSCNK